MNDFFKDKDINKALLDLHKRKVGGDMKIYISGKITGLKNYKKLFRKAEKRLIKKGFNVVNPVTLGEALPENSDWSKYMKMDLHAMLECNGIYLLDNWEDSKGAIIEEKVSRACGLVVFHEGEL